MMKRINHDDLLLSSRMESEIKGHVDAVHARNARYLNNPPGANPITGGGEATSGKNRKASAIIRAPPPAVSTRQHLQHNFNIIT